MGGESGVLPQALGDNLVGGDAVCHVLAGHGKAIGPGQPEGAAPVSFVGVLIGAALHDRDIRLVAGQRCESFGKLVVSAGLRLVRKPGFLGDPEADSKKDGSFRRSRGSASSSCGEPAETNRFESGQSDAGSGSARKWRRLKDVFMIFLISGGSVSIGQKSWVEMCDGRSGVACPVLMACFIPHRSMQRFSSSRSGHPRGHLVSPVGFPVAPIRSP